MTVVHEPDRIHVYTPRLEWTIRTALDQNDGIGPGYISDVRERQRPYRVLLSDRQYPGRTINDPQYGGLFGFGLVACQPDGAEPDPADFWNEAWELTTRSRGAFGVSSCSVFSSVGEEGKVRAVAEFQLRGMNVMSVEWAYQFGPGDEVACTLTATPRQNLARLWMKEAKIVANGLRGYRQLTVRDRKGTALERHDLALVGNPRAHTVQVSAPRRYAYELFDGGDHGPPLPLVTVTNDNGLLKWGSAADKQEPMSPNAIRADGTFGPAAEYCLTPREGLWLRTEVTRWGLPLDVTGILMHGTGEGGYGAPDCWNTFRPWPTEVAVARLGCRFTYP